MNDGRDDSGFTLIELLVVLLIIGILAAAGLPTFLGQSAKAQDARAKDEVRSAVTQMESCLVPGPPEATVAGCIARGLGEFRLVAATDLSDERPGSYRLSATSKAGPGHVYSITQLGQFMGFVYTAGPDATGKADWESDSTSP